MIPERIIRFVRYACIEADLRELPALRSTHLGNQGNRFIVRIGVAKGLFYCVKKVLAIDKGYCSFYGRLNSQDGILNKK